MVSSTSTSTSTSTGTTAAEGNPTCVLDRRVVNSKTVGDMADLGLSFFAPLCGRNRGAFVLDPTDGHTYGCTAFPPTFAELAGLPEHRLKHVAPLLTDANAIKEKFADGNVTAAETVELLDYLTKTVYHSTANRAADPFGCEVGGLARLQCSPPVNALATIRAVTLAGLFKDATWATGGKPLEPHQARSFYSQQDFDAMARLGLNAVQIPVSLEAFSEESDDKEESGSIRAGLSEVLAMAGKADLRAILSFAGQPDNDDAVAAVARYASSAKRADVVFGVTLPSVQSYRAARAAAGPALRLLVPVNLGDLKDLGDATKSQFPQNDPNAFAALDLGHSSTVGDVASSTSKDDRMKMFYHEAVACIQRSPLEYAACYPRVPVFVSGGFDLSVDDCVTRGLSHSKFVDYGQCDRFNETVGSDWWHRHRSSFAARQLFSYEQGLGWSFASWKLSSSSEVGVLDAPAKLLSFRDVAAAGLLPSLVKQNAKDPATKACLNPPVVDFELGDATLAPTAAPIDCGNGWLDPDTNNCTYWVPPATDPPGSANASCPECSECASSSAEAVVADNSALGIPGGDRGAYYVGGAGLVVGIALAVIWNRCFSSSRRTGYTEVPNGSSA